MAGEAPQQQDRVFVLPPESKETSQGEFYMPRLGRHVLPSEAPVQTIRFAARFRTVFNAEFEVAKHLDIDQQFGPVADHLHFNARDPGSGTWRFLRFAPAWARQLGRDLTGENVLHPAYAPYNTLLDDMLGQAVERETPFYAATHVGGPNGTGVAHRLLIPMSATGAGVSHCMVFTVV